VRRLPLFALMVTGLSLAGCGVGYEYYAVSAPPPVRVEVRGVAPGPGFIWINGYWGYTGGRYAWVPGRWERPPHPRSRWEEGRWERHGDRWGYRKGRWRR
jgi:hypothetical protein